MRRSADEILERNILDRSLLKIGEGALRGEKLPRVKGTLVRLKSLEDEEWEIPLGLVIPNPEQPREYFDPGKLEELKRTIQKQGQQQAIQVVPFQVGSEKHAKLLIIDGGRRHRVLGELKEPNIRAVIKWIPTADEVFERSVTLNIRQENNPLELAKACRRMIEKRVSSGMSKADAILEVGSTVGLSEHMVRNYLRLLTLSKEIQALILEGKLRGGAAETILNARSKHGDRLDEVTLAYQLISNPGKDFDKPTPGKRRGTFSKQAVRDAITETVMRGGSMSPDEAQQVEAAHGVNELSTAVQILGRRIGAVLGFQPRKVVVDVLRNKSGNPPEVLEERVADLVPQLQALYREIVRAALAPAPLDIPKGKPTFAVHIGHFQQRFGNPLRFEIARLLARASDNSGSLLTAQAISQALQNGQPSPPYSSVEIANNMRHLETELESTGLLLETHETRRRDSRGTLEKIPGYRLAWVPETSAKSK